MDKLIIFLCITNLACFLAFGTDKWKAKKGRWRIPEKTLLLMGLMFGSIGQLAGMKVFHHKTGKWYFWFRGTVSLAIHIVILYYLYTKCIV